jgi:hypothetical protein
MTLRGQGAMVSRSCKRLPPLDLVSIRLRRAAPQHDRFLFIAPPFATACSYFFTPLIAGALNYGSRTVADVMTKADDVFMLDISTKLNFEAMLNIYKSGFTRIPVYEHSREYIKGILYVKDLILVDPDDEIILEAIVAFRCAPILCPQG